MSPNNRVSAHNRVSPHLRDDSGSEAAKGRLRRLVPLILIAATLAAGMSGVVWWRERPLRTIEDLLRKKDGEQALLLADRFLKDFPDHSRAAALKARALVELGRAADAVRIFDRVGAASPEEMRACARAYLMVERWVQALPLLEYLIQSSPDDPDLLHEVSACRAKLGRYDQAIDAAQRFATQKGCEARGYLLIGTLERERHNYRKARDAWAHVLEIEPNAENLQISADEFFHEYGSALLQTGEPALALEQLTRSLELKSSPKTFVSLGTALAQLGRSAEAETAWQTALAQDPENESARQGLAEAAIRKKDFAAALEWLKPLNDQPNMASATAFLFQRAYALAGDSQTAELWQSEVDRLRKQEELQHTVDQVLIESPGSTWGQVLRAYRLAEQGRWDQAGILLSPIIEQPDHHVFVDQLNTAIQSQQTLPNLQELPIELF